MSKWGPVRAGYGGRRSAAFLTVIVALVVAALAVVTDALASSSTHLATAQRAALVPAGSKALGAPADSATQSGDVALKPRDPAALSAFVKDATTRSSAHYHQYLAAGQFAAKFGPTQATIDAVKSALTSDGLDVSGVSSNGMLVKFSGTTAKVEAAFNTRIERYTTTTGVTGEETTSSIELPSNISSDVSGVVGLNTLLRPTDDGIRENSSHAHAAAKKANITTYPAGAPKPCADATADSTSIGGLTDDQIANAYGAFPLYAAGDTGQNVHIGIYELAPFSTSDAQTFDQCYFGDSAATQMLTRLKTVPVDGGQTAGYGNGESILDVDDVEAMAPGADVDVYEGPASTGVYPGWLDTWTAMVDDDTDQILSSSYYDGCESDVEAYNPGTQLSEYYIFEQAAAQGQTVLQASGDAGVDTCSYEASPVPPAQNPISAEDPATQPYVVAVGGTSLQNADPANFSETVWNDGGGLGAGGGGISNTWTAPSWQQLAPGYSTSFSAGLTNANDVENHAVEDGISDQDWTPGFCQISSGIGTPCRTVPDISAAADEQTGGITVFSGAFATAGSNGWTQYGGTSSATPIWAAMLALVDASSACQTAGLSPTGNAGSPDGIGFAAPLLYAVAGSSATEPDGHSEYADAFHDTTTGNDDENGFDNGLTFPAHTGYDLATGLGSPELTDPDPSDPGLADDLCSQAAVNNATRPTVASLSVPAGPVAGGTSVTLTGHGFAPGSGVSVASVTVGDDVIPVSDTADLTVNSNTSLTIKAPAASLSLPASSAGIQDGAGPADIVVTLTNGVTSLPSVASMFNYVDEDASNDAEPSVSSVGPFQGSESGPAKATIYGSGFTATGDTITFGGVPATAAYTYVNPHEIKVTPPDFTEGTTDCATSTELDQDYGGAVADGGNGLMTPADFDTQDICQTEVQVTDAADDSSAEDTLLPDYEGALLDDYTGSAPEVPGLPDPVELFPQPTEYDYVPAPTITGITTSDGPANYAAAQGGTIIEIDGTGLNNTGLNWVNFGDPTAFTSQDFDIVAEGATYIDIEVPASPDYAANGAPDTDPETVPVTVDTSAGLSNASDATYAGVPTINSVALSGAGTGTDTLAGTTLPVGPVAGGSTVTVDGAGMSDVVGPIGFDDVFGVTASQYTFNASSDTEIDTQTLQTLAGPQDTVLCTVSGCTTPSVADAFVQYNPGTPSLTSVTVDDDTPSGAESGPASGGTTVTLTGENLSCTTAVEFGGVPAESFSNAPGVTGCDSPNTVTAVVPPGTLGTTVPITISTIAGDVANFDTATETGATFTYTANPTTTALAYGPVDLGASLSRTETVTNTSDHDLVIPANTPATDTTPASVGVTVTGTDVADFAITADQCSGATLSPGDNCTVTVVFTPLASGARAATLSVPYNASVDPISVALSGTGAIPSTTTTVTTSTTTTVTTPATTVTTPATTVTTTVTGPTRTVTTTNTRYFVCLGTPHYKYKNVKVKVKVKVRVKVNGTYKTETKTETKVEKKKLTTYTYACTLETAVPKAERLGARTKAAAEAKARTRAEAEANKKKKKKRK